MTFYPAGDLAPVQVRIYQAHLEQRALAQGLAERSERQATPPPTSQPGDGEGYGEPSPPRQPHVAQRIWRYRALAAFVSLLCAGAFGVLGLAIVTSDLSLFAALATLAVFGFALSLLEAWALPSLYRWVYWRYLLATWR